MNDGRAALASERAERIFDEVVALGAPRRMMQRLLFHDVNVIRHVAPVRRHGAHRVVAEVLLALLVNTHVAVFAFENTCFILAEADELHAGAAPRRAKALVRDPFVWNRTTGNCFGNRRKRQDFNSAQDTREADLTQVEWNGRVSGLGVELCLAPHRGLVQATRERLVGAGLFLCDDATHLVAQATALGVVRRLQRRGSARSSATR